MVDGGVCESRRARGNGGEGRQQALHGAQAGPEQRERGRETERKTTVVSQHTQVLSTWVPRVSTIQSQGRPQTRHVDRGNGFS